MKSVTETAICILICLLLTTSSGQKHTPVPDFETLVKQLQDRTAKGGFGCMDAARALGELGDPRAVGPLIDLLNDASFRNEIARASVPEALSKIGDPQAIEPLIVFLGRNQFRSSHCCRAAIEALGDFGNARAIPVLVSCAADRSPSVRDDAIEALGKIDHPSATEALARLEQTNPRPIHRNPVVREMDRRRREGGVYDLVQRFRTADRQQRTELASKLMEAGVLAVKPLGDLLIELNEKAEKAERSDRYDDPRRPPDTRLTESARAQAEMQGMRQAIRKESLKSQRTQLLQERKQLASHLKRLESRLRRQGRSSRYNQADAKEEWQRISNRIQAINLALAVVSNEARAEHRAGIARRAGLRAQELKQPRRNPERQNDYELQKVIIEILAKIGDPHASKPIANALSRHDEQVRFAARNALLTFGPASVRPLLDVLDSHRHDHITAQIIFDVFVDFGPVAVDPLIELLSRGRSVSGDVAKVLARIGDPRAIEPLIAYFNQRDKHGPNGVVALASELARFRDPRVMDTLINHLHRHGQQASPAVARALGQHGDRRALKHLRACLDDSQSALALSAAMALLRLSGPAALPSVVPLVEQHGTSSELITLLAFHGWRPANQRQEVYFWLALDRQELLAHWEQTKRVLLVPPYYNYSLFLSLRKHDPEVINAMVSLLNTVTPPQGVNQKSLAENYFRSDHPSLVIAGARWLSNHGTRVELWSLPFGRNIHIPAGNFNAQFANQIRNQMGPQGRWE